MVNIFKSFFKLFIFLDWSKKPAVFLLAGLFSASRIFLVLQSFGSDPDAWRIANSAYDLRYSGIYHVSRFPGFPVPEIVNALVIPFGWLATNSLTLIISFISVIIFAKILSCRNEPNKGLLTFTYAFMPILWVNSANTMDYLWALAFILASWYLILIKRPLIAGIALGVAIGSRLTSGVFGIPFLLLIWTKHQRIKPIVLFLIASASSAFILYLPILYTYGLTFLTGYPASISISLVVTGLFRQFGALAVLFGILLMLISAKKTVRLIMTSESDTLFLLCAIAIIVLIFSLAPYETAYLIPAVPFALVLFNKVSRPSYIVIFCLLTFANFGLISKTITTQKKELQMGQHILSTEIQPKSMVISGWWVPYIAYLNNHIQHKGETPFAINDTTTVYGVYDAQKDIYYIYPVPLTSLTALLEKGYTVYYAEGMDIDTRNQYQYDITRFPCIPMKLPTLLK